MNLYDTDFGSSVKISKKSHDAKLSADETIIYLFVRINIC